MAESGLILPGGAAGAAARSGVDPRPRAVTFQLPDRQVPQTADLQAVAEGVVEPIDDGKIEFMGEWFRLADEVGIMPMLAFAHAADNGLDSGDMAGLSAMYALIRDTVDQSRPVEEGPGGEPLFEKDGTPKWAGPSDWMRFERHAINEKADGEDLMEFIQRATKVIASRPTKRHGGSSPSSPPKSESTKGDSPLRVPGGRTVPGIGELRSVADFGQQAR